MMHNVRGHSQTTLCTQLAHWYFLIGKGLDGIKYTMAKTLQYELKSRYSEKATKFEKILHLEFDATH